MEEINSYALRKVTEIIKSLEDGKKYAEADAEETEHRLVKLIDDINGVDPVYQLEQYGERIAKELGEPDPSRWQWSNHPVLETLSEFNKIVSEQWQSLQHSLELVYQ